MSVAISGIIALVLMGFYFKWPKQIYAGIGAIFFWLIFMGAGWVNAGGWNPSDIYFYFAWAGFGMVVTTLIAVLSFSPEKQAQEEKKIEEPHRTNRLDDLRAKRGLRALHRE